jgi:hypothetical protein
MPFSTGEWQDDGLHTPCQDVPMEMPGGCRSSRAPVRGDEWTSYGWKRLASGFFGAGTGGEWRVEDQMFFDPTRPKEMSLGFTREEIEYAKMSERKNREVFQKMGNRQKRLLNMLESGRIFKLSRLKPDTDAG